MVTLLVGARYGVSQVVNHKLNILTTLTEFSCITRIELLPESEKVSLVKMYLQDIKVRFLKTHKHERRQSLLVVLQYHPSSYTHLHILFLKAHHTAVGGSCRQGHVLFDRWLLPRVCRPQPQHLSLDGRQEAQNFSRRR